MAEESVLDTSIPPNEADNSDTLTDKHSELDCESMTQALAFYNKILENTDAKDIKKKIKKVLRVNALAIVKIVASQNAYISQLEGRVQTMEQYFAEINNKQQAIIKNAVAKELDR
ncbi:hypothetical protein CEXT_318831 [Caerostris extrusa]|uniref:Uncharacterized protein n=1 Tax=Caerostris extrusa TaxID=172846 RepID=A0AAV4MFL1_CAEEX|nr:hypothetical protein CEXT_318831 [Caerostris extrusa]